MLRLNIRRWWLYTPTSISMHLLSYCWLIVNRLYMQEKVWPTKLDYNHSLPLYLRVEGRVPYYINEIINKDNVLYILPISLIITPDSKTSSICTWSSTHQHGGAKPAKRHSLTGFQLVAHLIFLLELSPLRDVHSSTVGRCHVEVKVHV